MNLLKEYFGIGSLEQVRPILAAENPQSIFLVHGRVSYRQSGAGQILGPLLQNYAVTPFTDFSSNAKIEDVEKGIVLFQQNNCDFIIAVGGGSALDIAKAVALLADHPERAENYILKRALLHPRTTPLLAIPTTAGTGSEATHFAAIYIDKTKYSLAHPDLIPDYAIIDPSLTFSLPPYQTACTGMDALSQAIESYWSVHSTDESKQYAAEAIILAVSHLENAVLTPSSESRIALAKAANLAGKAINISFTTACHAISYPITSYFNVPHGHAVALTLPEMIVYNSELTEKDCSDQRGIAYVRSILGDICRAFGVLSPKEFKIRIEQLLNSIGLERRLSLLGVGSDENIEIILKKGFNPERMGNNPRVVTEPELKKMLSRIK